MQREHLGFEFTSDNNSLLSDDEMMKRLRMLLSDVSDVPPRVDEYHADNPPLQGYGRAFKLVLEAIPDAIPISIVAGAPRFVDELFVPGCSKGCSYDEFRPDPGIREMISSSRRRCSSTAAVGVAKRPRIGQSGQESSGGHSVSLDEAKTKDESTLLPAPGPSVALVGVPLVMAPKLSLPSFARPTRPGSFKQPVKPASSSAPLVSN